MSIQITDNNFEELIKNSKKTIVIDFWASWCGPCKQLAPTIDRLAKEYGDKALVGKVDVDANSILTAKFGIRTIPTIIFLQNGKIVDKKTGNVQYSILEQTLKAIL